jgi:transposase-like protein
MSGFLAFCGRYRNEAACIQTLADLKWPQGFICEECQGHKAYHLACRPRLFECAGCGHQHSVTAGTIFHQTRTDLRKWFIAAYLMAHDKRGVSALFISRELAVRYDTAWLMCHKLRHALTDDSRAFKLDHFVEVDAVFYGGRQRQGSQGRAQTAGRAVIVCAVEKVSTAGTRNKGIDKQGFIAGSARIAVLANTSAEQLGAFIRSNIKPGALIVGDRRKDYAGRDAYQHLPVVPGTRESAAVAMPIVRRLCSNVRTWLNGTHHGVSVKHLGRYLREWSYRFNRRHRIDELDGFLLRRAVSRKTITCAGLVGGMQLNGAP